MYHNSLVHLGELILVHRDLVHLGIQVYQPRCTKWDLDVPYKHTWRSVSGTAFVALHVVPKWDNISMRALEVYRYLPADRHC